MNDIRNERNGRWMKNNFRIHSIHSFKYYKVDVFIER